MQKQVVFPEFLGESELAIVVVISSLKRDLSHLFERFHAGEEIDYWFNWNLVVTDTAEYLVVLELEWDQGEGLTVAFSREMWEFLGLMIQKENLVLLADWQMLEEGAPVMAEVAEFKPYALLIRDVDAGLDRLYDHVRELAEVNQEIEELTELMLILEGAESQPITLH
ncbi:hypothetical protein Desca_1839 [Desulfotomaculum nigrificans CO-1-SRB]|uniref:Uncharacterized protein n=1 Tax=Desulfotomaculum nigrificans (strain DSM 14880 / VKM B-2319 / CO-1-SRB) TaxID=868595 RepID=F6B8C0_DESCC|nr:hypothetical protein [Desulfotomaculum nigrificans]AEF94684.1 hypothetical protein Desca_1839 [Desulfotomaculum nigrificans CO-1-SRB]